jgi:FAD/FMN-containing dehydrogenase
MRRRDLLKLTALAPCAPLILGGCTASLTNTAATPRRRARPTDAAWPSNESWRRLNETLGGKLIPVHPLFAPCALPSESARCTEVLQYLDNPFYLGDQAAGSQVSGWLDAWMPAPSVYAIKARTTADVVAGVNFARLHNLRLVVKGTGHSYLGTSNAADSLLIWTRAMNRVQVREAFVPKGCFVAPVPAVTAEAGAVSIDLYYAVTTGAGRYVQGGGCTDTGIAGLVQSGGFGSFSKGYGTAASNLLEAEVVSADGSVLTANACLNPDLFWALKGGGGGTFGVITRATLQTHELPKTFGKTSASIKAQSDAAFKRLIAQFLTFYRESLLNPHWGEQVKVGADNTLEISMASQGVEHDQMHQIWKPLVVWITGSPQDFILMHPGGVAMPARAWWDVENNPAMVHDTRPGSPKQHCWWRGDQGQVGAFLHGFESLWLPASLLEAKVQHRLVEALFAASRFKQVQLHMNKGLAWATPEVRAAVRQTATNPAVLDAFALAIIADGEGPAYPGMPRPPLNLGVAHTDARAIDRAADELRKLVPDAGSYVSESNYFNPSWQRAYWGHNYARLRAIKKRYDPDGLFFVHHGVGSEQWSPDGFTRL